MAEGVALSFAFNSKLLHPHEFSPLPFMNYTASESRPTPTLLRIPKRILFLIPKPARIQREFPRHFWCHPDSPAEVDMTYHKIAAQILQSIQRTLEALVWLPMEVEYPINLNFLRP